MKVVGGTKERLRMFAGSQPISQKNLGSPGGGFSLRTGHSSAEGQFGDGKARGFRRPIPGGPGGSGISDFGIGLGRFR